jgi:hypothetical protein
MDVKKQLQHLQPPPPFARTRQEKGAPKPSHLHRVHIVCRNASLRRFCSAHYSVAVRTSPCVDLLTIHVRLTPPQLTHVYTSTPPFHPPTHIASRKVPFQPVFIARSGSETALDVP